MSGLEELFGIFKGNKKAETTPKRDSAAFVEHYLKDEQLQKTLDTLDRVVASQSWTVDSVEHPVFYRNETLSEAVHVGVEAQELKNYMAEGSETYQGAELNEDVLKTVLTHFLDTIEPYEFYAFTQDVDALYDKVVNTPIDMVKYIIEERAKKLESLTSTENVVPDVALARRILELDVMLQLQKSQTGKATEVPHDISYYAELFADAVEVSLSPHPEPETTGESNADAEFDTDREAHDSVAGLHSQQIHEKDSGLQDRTDAAHVEPEQFVEDGVGANDGVAQEGNTAQYTNQSGPAKEVDASEIGAQTPTDTVAHRANADINPLTDTNEGDAFEK